MQRPAFAVAAASIILGIRDTKNIISSEAFVPPVTIPTSLSSTRDGTVSVTCRRDWFLLPEQKFATRCCATHGSSKVTKDEPEDDKEVVSKSTLLRKANVRSSKATVKMDGSLSCKDRNGEVKPPIVKKRRKKTASSEPMYWHQESDEFVLKEIEDSGNGSTSADQMGSRRSQLIRFTVRGKPVPLRRHRTSKGFMYNPSAAAQASFRKVVQEMVWSTQTTNGVPLFDKDKHVAMTILFRLKRPKSHFVGGKPGPGRLRPSAPHRLHPSRTDVDNLAKFVLDSLNEVLYVDDRQVVSLHATKVLDTEGECEGATEVCMQCLNEDNVDDFLRQSFDLK